MTHDSNVLAEHGIDLFGLFDELVERSGMSQYRIAKETGVDAPRLSRYARRELRPTLESLVAIAELSGTKIKLSISRPKKSPETRREQQ